MNDPRQKPGRKDDPNLGQEEAEREKLEKEEDDIEDTEEGDDELEPMTDQQPRQRERQS